MFRPSFEKGSVLKQNMLEALRDYPYRIVELEYAEYGEGIISGFNVCIIDDKKLQITPGILKHDGKIYISTDDIQVDQMYEKHYVYLEIACVEKTDGVNFVINVNQTEEYNNFKMELFRYTKNADLHEFKSIQEVFNIPINRINQIGLKQSVAGGSTLSQKYYKLFAKEIMSCENAGVADVAFAYQCLNGISNLDIVGQYFNGVVSNDGVIEGMKKKITQLSKTNVVIQNEPVRRERPKQMIVT